MEMASLLKNKSLIWSSVGVLVLIVGIFVALQLVPQEQDIRQEAAQNIPAAIGEIKISPVTMDLTPNTEKTATVQVNTKGIKARGISAVLSYPYTGATPAVTASEIVMAAPFNAEPWNCPVKKVELKQNSVIVQVACVISGTTAPDGYQSSALADFFTFKLKSGETSNQPKVLISFNQTETSINTIDDNSPDLAAVSALNTLTVNLLPGPVAEKKITLKTPELACTLSTPFSAEVTVTEGSVKKAGVALTFKYNNETKTASTNADGVAIVLFQQASTALPVTVEAEGYTTVTATATPATNCNNNNNNNDDDDDDTNRLKVTVSGLTCGANDFKAKATTVNVTNKANVSVQFSYNGENKTATTNSNGEAEVSFIRATSNTTVRATASSMEGDSETVTLPTNCSGTTTGLSCNQTCTATRDCRSGLTCVSGYCRAPQCSSDTSCGCADLDVAAQNGTTQLPQSGFDQTLAITILGLLFLIGGGQLWWSRKALHTTDVSEEDNR